MNTVISFILSLISSPQLYNATLLQQYVSQYACVVGMLIDVSSATVDVGKNVNTLFIPLIIQETIS